MVKSGKEIFWIIWWNQYRESRVVLNIESSTSVFSSHLYLLPLVSHSRFWGSEALRRESVSLRLSDQ